MGLFGNSFNDNKDDFLGGLFDFNHDGVTSSGEKYTAYKIYEDIFEESAEDDKYKWRDYCVDGSEYGVNPEDYEYEHDYLQALEEAQDVCGD